MEIHYTNVAWFTLSSFLVLIWKNGKVKDFFNLYSDSDIVYFKDPDYEGGGDPEYIKGRPVTYVLNEVEKEGILRKQNFIKEFLLELNQRQVFL